jgi:hypothetical protein
MPVSRKKVREQQRLQKEQEERARVERDEREKLEQEQNEEAKQRAEEEKRVWREAEGGEIRDRIRKAVHSSSPRTVLTTLRPPSSAVRTGLLVSVTKQLDATSPAVDCSPKLSKRVERLQSIRSAWDTEGGIFGLPSEVTTASSKGRAHGKGKGKGKGKGSWFGSGGKGEAYGGKGKGKGKGKGGDGKGMEWIGGHSRHLIEKKKQWREQLQGWQQGWQKQADAEKQARDWEMEERMERHAQAEEEKATSRREAKQKKKEKKKDKQRQEGAKEEGDKQATARVGGHPATAFAALGAGRPGGAQEKAKKEEKADQQQQEQTQEQRQEEEQKVEGERKEQQEENQKEEKQTEEKQTEEVELGSKKKKKKKKRGQDLRVERELAAVSRWRQQQEEQKQHKPGEGGEDDNADPGRADAAVGAVKGLEGNENKKRQLREGKEVITGQQVERADAVSPRLEQEEQHPVTPKTSGPATGGARLGLGKGMGLFIDVEDEEDVSERGGTSGRSSNGGKTRPNTARERSLKLTPTDRKPPTVPRTTTNASSSRRVDLSINSRSKRAAAATAVSVPNSPANASSNGGKGSGWGNGKGSAHSMGSTRTVEAALRAALGSMVQSSTPTTPPSSSLSVPNSPASMASILAHFRFDDDDCLRSARGGQQLASPEGYTKADVIQMLLRQHPNAAIRNAALSSSPSAPPVTPSTSTVSIPSTPSPRSSASPSTRRCNQKTGEKGKAADVRDTIAADVRDTIRSAIDKGKGRNIVITPRESSNTREGKQIETAEVKSPCTARQGSERRSSPVDKAMEQETGEMARKEPSTMHNQPGKQDAANVGHQSTRSPEQQRKEQKQLQRRQKQAQKVLEGEVKATLTTSGVIGSTCGAGANRTAAEVAEAAEAAAEVKEASAARNRNRRMRQREARKAKAQQKAEAAPTPVS